MYRYYFEIAGIGISVISPVQLSINNRLSPFVKKEKTGNIPDVIYQVEMVGKLNDPEGYISYKSIDYDCCVNDANMYRIYYMDSLRSKRILLKRKRVFDGRYFIYVEEKEKEIFSHSPSLIAYLALEEVWLFHHATVLHGSLVAHQGKGIIFTAASGVGKTTQALLWQKYRSAEIINGDRVILRKMENGSYAGYGSPYAGSSGIYKNSKAPVSGIFVLEQAYENRVEKMKDWEKWTALYKESLQNSWNAVFQAKLFELLDEQVEKLPIYLLKCRPDKKAVELAEKYI